MPDDMTISHSDLDGTLLAGSSRGDGSAEVVKTHGWRWGRSIGAWYVPRSRNRPPARPLIEATAAALRAAGFSVTVTVDATVADQEEAERERTARSADRSDRLSERATRRREQADTAWDNDRRLTDRLPPGGEPIKVGHHSESRHRRDLERAWNALGQAVTAEDDAREAARRAEVAAHAAAARHAPVTVANRVQRFAADVRRDARQLEQLTARGAAESAYGVELAERLAHTRAELEHWQKVRAAQIAAGTATGYSRDQVAAGDLVKIRGQWRRVVRASRATVSVETGYSWTDRAPWHEVQDHRPDPSRGGGRAPQ